jgi:uncharacterized membrane protein (UPF0182 family)
MRNTDPFADLLRSLENDLGREGGAPPPPRREEPWEPRPGGSRWILWVLLPLLLFIFFSRLVGFYTNWIWYDSVGQSQVFVTRLWASFALFLVGALVVWLFVAANVWLARRLEPRSLYRTPLEAFAAGIGVSISTIILIFAGIFALFMGLAAANAWEVVLVYLNQLPYGLADPLFSRDVSFYLFTLPVWEATRTWLMVVLAATIVATGGVTGLGWRDWRASKPVLTHLAVLGALMLGLMAWQYRLDAFQLVYGNRSGAVFGAGYADVHAQLPAYNALTVITLIAALLLVVAPFVRQAWRAIVAVLAIWILIAVVAGNVYPSLVQRFQVDPNELNLERPYIANNIEFTRLAYDLAAIDERGYTVKPQLTAEELLQDAETVRNVRLWDYRPLLQTYNQIQALRQYYEFNDVDVDRYTVGGSPQQVMLAARELVPERLSEDAQTWVNRRLVYTHGYGVAVSPVAQVTRDGLPEFLLKDLPPQGVISVTQPQIYFGELTDDYVIAATTEPEFDYPRGDGNVTTHFAADTGIEMTLWARLLFAIRFADINVLLNRDIDRDSQLLWKRDIVERTQELAPFLLLDADPYIVIGDDGRLYWIIDAYTVSNRFPYSEPYETINYMRNPVKVIISAYDGTTQFFRFDEEEPVAAAYARIFPTLFASKSDIPADLLRNIRYPTDLFTVQAEVYRTYHMTDVTEFYNREDLWSWPQEVFSDQTVAMEPYYVLMELPDEDTVEYVQILPFTPANRENMIAWMAARSDPEFYGDMRVYEFGKDSLFFGPKQVEARIDQDPVISSQLSLWNQQGSSVIRGNLLVIPVAGTLLYVEPLYLQAASGRIPELQRVVVATSDRVVMAENLGLALVELYGRKVLEDAGLAALATSGVDAASGPAAVPDDGSATVAQLVEAANTHFAAAQANARAGNWAGYGEEMAALQATLEELARAADVPLATPTPAAPDEAPAAEAPQGDGS